VKIGIPKEIIADENRVAMIPRTVGELVKKDHQVLVEAGAGERAGYADEAYTEAGAQLVDGAAELYEQSGAVVKVNRLSHHPELGKHEAELLKPETTIVGLLDPLNNPGNLQQLVDKKLTVFSMEFLPRITRAQSMDVLSSMSTVSGYKAVLVAAESLPRFFPLLMTAAGTIPPATALIIGAGVAGLQAIATAKRLGAKVFSFDTRPAVKEQVESLGARFVEMELEEEAETESGYAKEMSEEFYRRELEAIGNQAERSDIIISTALIFGKKAPILITEEMVENMQYGSVIVDLAGSNGGNCEVAEPGESVVKHGVTIHTPLNLPATLPYHASQMYSKNMSNFLSEILQDEAQGYDFDNQVVADTCIAAGGEIRNDLVRNALQGKDE